MAKSVKEEPKVDAKKAAPKKTKAPEAVVEETPVVEKPKAEVDVKAETGSYWEYSVFVRLTKEELLDAIAVGQFTPGPVLTTATFIGYQLHGLSGAFMASLGMFLPSFLFVAILVRIIPSIKSISSNLISHI